MSITYKARLSLNAEQGSPGTGTLLQEVHCRKSGESHSITFDLTSCGNVTSLKFQPSCEPVLIEVLNVNAVTESSRELSPVFCGSNALWESGTQYLFDNSSPELSYTIPESLALTGISFQIIYRSSGAELHAYIVRFLKEAAEKRDAELRNLGRNNDELNKKLILQKNMIVEDICDGSALERLNVAARILFPRGTALRKILGFFSKCFKYLKASIRKTNQKALNVSDSTHKPHTSEKVLCEDRNMLYSSDLTDVLNKRMDKSLDQIGKISNIHEKAVFTIVSKNHLARALTLRDSFLAFNQDYDFIIFMVDMVADKEEIAVLSVLIESGIDIRFVHELGRIIQFRNFEHMLLKYDIAEANKAFKPFCFEYLMKTSYRKIVYLDSDILVLGAFDECDRVLDLASMVFTPHIMEHCGKDSPFTDADILKKGVFNLGFLALRNSGKTQNLITWWGDKVYSDGFMTEGESLQADRRWTDLFPSFVSDLHIIRDRGYNAACWNLHERCIWKHEGIWKAGNDRLVFFHFSGSFSDGFSVTPHCQHDIHVENNGVIHELFREYGEKLREYSRVLPQGMKYYYSYLHGSGCRISDEQRRDAAEQKVLSECAFHNKPCLPTLCATSDTQKRKSDLGEEPAGLTLAGYFSNTTGISQTARSFASNLFRSGIPFSLKNSLLQQHPEIDFQSMARFADRFSDELPYRLILLFYGSDEILQAFMERSELFSPDHYRAAVLWWEFESGSESFLKGFDHIDEILVFNDFLRAFYTSIAPGHVRIHKLLYPFHIDWIITEPRDVIRNRYGITIDEFVFFFHFDCFSSIMRKNPAAVIQSFAQVFQGKSCAKLVLKMNNTSFYTAQTKKLISMINDLGVSERVVIINESLPRNGLMTLINATDCYVSLHRGEGMGLGILEAMSLGKPVICTAYGGNMEFTKKDNSFLVEYAMVDAKPDIDAYRWVKQWAEPSIDQAAEYMYYLYNDRDASRSMGEKARQYVQSYFSPEQCILDILKYVRDRL
ncbi:MAG: glycosyltransferase [Candidatus Xenobiia bacterium LiM19]